MHESSIAWHKKVFFVRLLHLTIGPVTSAASLQAFPYGNTTQDERQSLLWRGYIRPVTSICNYECVSQSQMLPVSTVLVLRICDTQAGSMRLTKYPSCCIHCPPGRNRKRIESGFSPMPPKHCCTKRRVSLSWGRDRSIRLGTTNFADRWVSNKQNCEIQVMKMLQQPTNQWEMEPQQMKRHRYVLFGGPMENTVYHYWSYIPDQRSTNLLRCFQYIQVMKAAFRSNQKEVVAHYDSHWFHGVITLPW